MMAELHGDGNVTIVPIQEERPRPELVGLVPRMLHVVDGRAYYVGWVNPSSVFARGTWVLRCVQKGRPVYDPLTEANCPEWGNPA